MALVNLPLLSTPSTSLSAASLDELDFRPSW